MARKNLIGYYDWATLPGATLTLGSWQANLPRSNMLDHNPQIVAETVDTNTSSTRFACDFGQTLTCDVFLLAGLNITTYAATVRLYAYSNAGMTVVVYDSGPLIVWSFDINEWHTLGKCKWFVPPASVGVRAVRVEIDSSAVAGAVQIGKFGAWQCYEPSRFMDFGWTLRTVDPMEKIEVPGGATYITKRQRKRRIDFEINNVPQSEIDTLRTILNITGQSTPTVFVPFPDDNGNGLLEKQSIYGMYDAELAYSNTHYIGGSSSGRAHHAAFSLKQL